MQAGLDALYGLPIDNWRNYDAQIDAVDAAALRRFAQTYLLPARRTQLVVRPGSPEDPGSSGLP
jgi:zinc protease